MTDKELLKTIQNDIKNLEKCIEMCNDEDGIDNGAIRLAIVLPLFSYFSVALSVICITALLSPLLPFSISTKATTRRNHST